MIAFYLACAFLIVAGVAVAIGSVTAGGEHRK